MIANISKFNKIYIRGDIQKINSLRVNDVAGFHTDTSINNSRKMLENIRLFLIRDNERKIKIKSLYLYIFF